MMARPARGKVRAAPRCRPIVVPCTRMPPPSMSRDRLEWNFAIVPSLGARCRQQMTPRACFSACPTMTEACEAARRIDATKNRSRPDHAVKGEIRTLVSGKRARGRANLALAAPSVGLVKRGTQNGASTGSHQQPPGTKALRQRSRPMLRVERAAFGHPVARTWARGSGEEAGPLTEASRRQQGWSRPTQVF